MVVYVVSDAFAVSNRVRINTFALAVRIPTMHANREYIETGGLISYGTNYPDLFRRAVTMSTKSCAARSAATFRSSNRRSSWPLAARAQQPERMRRIGVTTS